MGDSTDSEDPAPRFDLSVPDNGYRWWYVDGISDDGKSGIVVIAFIGSVFSPYYFHARSRGNGRALDYCAINVGLYRERGKLWAMTERASDNVTQTADLFQVGPSSYRWDNGRLVIDLRERSMPFGQNLAGSVVVDASFLNPERFSLAPEKRHMWRPISPIGRIEVNMRSPACRWSGAAYLDTNWGTRPLEDDFVGWNWSRHANRDRSSITYAADLLDNSRFGLALDFDREGRLSEREVPPELTLPATGWRIDRRTRSDSPMRVRRTLEDTPFYARSILENGSGELVMHESLSLQRFRRGWVRCLLPFRMPRRRKRIS